MYGTFPVVQWQMKKWRCPDIGWVSHCIELPSVLWWLCQFADTIPSIANQRFLKWTTHFEVNKDGVLHGQLKVTNPRGRIPALVHHTGLVQGFGARCDCTWWVTWWVTKNTSKLQKTYCHLLPNVHSSVTHGGRKPNGNQHFQVHPETAKKIDLGKLMLLMHSY